MSILKFFDELFCYLEGSAKPAKHLNGTETEEQEQLEGLSDVIFSLKSENLNSLDGAWADDKLKFRDELISSLNKFVKNKRWKKEWKPKLLISDNGKLRLCAPMSIYYKPYNSENTINLDLGIYITENELEKRGGRPKATAYKYRVISKYLRAFLKRGVEENPEGIYEDEDIVRKTCKKSNYVYNTEDVICDNVPKIEDLKEFEFENNELNQLIENFINKLSALKRVPKIYHNEIDRCYYIPSEDIINTVDFRNFKNMEGYYSTLFHEIIHSTKNRKTENGKPVRKGFDSGKFGSVPYACEELVAEMGAYILCTEFGFSYTKQNTLAYLNSWRAKAEKERNDILLEAYGQACQAVEFLMKDIDVMQLIPKELTNRAKAETKEEKSTKKPKAEEEPKTEEKPKAKPKTEEKPKAEPKTEEEQLAEKAREVYNELTKL